MQTKTRFAPSPTGAIHIGNLRTALYAYLVAKKNNGKFMVRIEDTDQERFVEGALEKILKSLSWVGIKTDEGVLFNDDNTVEEKGSLGPYFQSKRLEIYKTHIQKLLDENLAYPCFCSKQRLDELRATQTKEKKPPKYDKCCLGIPKEEAQKRISDHEQHVIRLNIPEDKIISFQDEVYGKISVKGETLDDQVLIKSDGFPTYHFAVVVDDHLMEVSHIVRGEDWLPSTPKHALLYEYLGWDLPTFVHVPNILGENKKKLSKRQGDVSVDDFIEKGYLPEAIVNFIALLGWNPKSEQEHFSLKQLEETFDISGLNKAGAIFDYKKLDWMNAHYIKEKSLDDLFEETKTHLGKYCQEKGLPLEESFLKKITQVEKGRIKKIIEITENIDFYFEIGNYETSLLNWKENDAAQTKQELQKALEILTNLEQKDFEIEKLEKILLETAGDKKGDFLWPLRVALTGEEKSPSPFEVCWVLGKKESLKRVESAITKIG